MKPMKIVVAALFGALCIGAAMHPAEAGGEKEWEQAKALLKAGKTVQAVKPLSAAAKAGSFPARHALARLLESGRGVKADPVRARGMYEWLSKKGFEASTFRLGVMLYEGRGGPQDIGRSRSLLEQAAKNPRNHVADFLLGIMAARGEAGPQDAKRAYRHFLRAAEKGSRDGIFKVGVALEHGEGTGVDLQSAMAWYRKAAEMGSKDADQAVRDLARRIGEDGKSQGPAYEGSFYVQLADFDRSIYDGPVRKYKGVVLVGSKVKPAKNETFFTMMSQAIDMAETIPTKGRRKARLIGRVVYDPGGADSKAKGASGELARFFPNNRAYDPKGGKRPGVMVQRGSLAFTSPLRLMLFGLHKNGLVAGYEQELRTLLRKLDGGNGNQDLEKRANALAAIVAGDDSDTYFDHHCEMWGEQVDVMKAIKAPQDMIDGLSDLMFQRHCQIR